VIDLHSHILPGLCDGSQDLETSLEMARLAVADGTTHLACTPHIYPGAYNNSTSTIAPALEALQSELDRRDIPLQLVIGADIHMTPEVITGLRNGDMPTLNHSRYFLLEPSHHYPVIDFVDRVGTFIANGYIPVITHPERLDWIESHYEQMLEVARMGAWLQITAGAISGDFGKTARAWSRRFLEDGFVHLIASDAHGTGKRPPVLSAGIAEAIAITGDEAEVMRAVRERPAAILENLPPDAVSPPPGLQRKDATGSGISEKRGQPAAGKGLLHRIFRGRGKQGT